AEISESPAPVECPTPPVGGTVEMRLALSAPPGAGGRGRQRCLSLCGTARKASPAIGSPAQMLEDVRAVFIRLRVDRLSTAELIHHLSRPGLDPQRLANRLRQVGVSPTTMRLPNGEIRKGYYRSEVLFAKAIA